MKPTHTYILEPYKSPSTRHTCPSCGAKRQFARYINTESGEYLADHVGRCNREQNCSYHYTPKQYFLDHPEKSSILLHPITPKPTFSNFQIPKFSNSPTLSHCHISTLSHSLIPDTIFQSSLSNYKSNHFITFLKSIFNPSTITQLINTYFIGTSKNWPGSTVFWQIDCHGKTRDGKIMLYDSANGHRIKHPFNHITWAHSALKLKDYNLQQCFFGEHLLNLHPTLPVSIVESEKTAIIASAYFPQFIWLATGGKHGCKWSSPHVATVLTGRHITLWPDIKAYDDWKLKANELSKFGLRLTISNLLEQVATESEREAGLDIADFLIRFQPAQFVNLDLNLKESNQLPNCQIAELSHSLINKLPNPQILKSSEPPITEFSNFQIPKFSNSQFRQSPPENKKWDLTALESFFSSIQLPATPIRLNQSTVIHNLPKFISGHLAVLRIYNGNKVFLSYLRRLQFLQQIIQS